MRNVILGKTGLNISEVGFGGIPVIRLDQKEAIKVLHRACDKGITFYDTANAYKDSEEKMGRAFTGMRHQIVLATKTLRRDAAGAIEQLENSLRMLRTDYIDIYQLHQIAQDKDWKAVTGSEGALEALGRAREKGQVRFIGVTSHSIPKAVELVNAGLFDTIQVPFNFIEEEAKGELLAAAGTAGMGILAMKPFAGGMIDNAEIAFKYLRQFPAVLPIPGFDSVASVDQVTALYREPNEVTEKDRRLFEKYRSELGKKFCRRCEYCQPYPAGVMITPAMAYRVIASRMSAAVAVEFARAAMESTRLCTACGECQEHCPYELPIQEMLKANYDLYERHRLELGKN